jgi:hypothetical protein
LVTELALDVTGRGCYESITRRPGLRAPRRDGEALLNFVADPRHPFHAPNGVYSLAPAGGSLLRYTYATPDFVLGTSMVPARPAADWTNISSQNRWDGVIFAGSPTARIFAQPLQPARGSVYNAYWSVQKRGVLIVQRLKGSNAKGHRLWFDAGLRRVERDGWVFAEAPSGDAPRAYAAVRVVSGGTAWEADSVAQHREGKGAVDGGQWLACRDEFAPAILEVARRSDCADFAEFQRLVLAHPLRWANSRLDYTSALAKTTLTLFADYSRPPLIDGAPVNYEPARAYDSPFIQGDFGAGVVTLRLGGKSLVLDFG